MAKREFLQLAHNYNPKKHGIGGWFLSEKLDGMRAFWDGGISRGIPKKDVPWANNTKDSRYQIPPIATGLWSRYGNVIHAPDMWLDRLPDIPLDGELWIGRESRQRLMSIVKQLIPNGLDWGDVSYYVFDSPPFERIFADGIINNTNYHKMISWYDIEQFINRSSRRNKLISVGSISRFETIVTQLKDFCSWPAIYLPQEQLPFQTILAEETIRQKLIEISMLGGEGLMLREPSSFWWPERTYKLLKVKKLQDMEGEVIGYITGKETDKGSKLLGMMGALILKLPNGARMELSGFTDDERQLQCIENSVPLSTFDARDWARRNPGIECPAWIENPSFPRGDKVSFKYRGESRDGIPQEARYWRK